MVSPASVIAGHGSGALRLPRSVTAHTPLLARTYHAAKQVFAAAETYSRLNDRHRFDDRCMGHPVLVCMLAGYKPDLWPLVMPRFRSALPAADVCLITPGKHDGSLADLCRREGWSYLTTATNDVALAQNVCFRLHSQADMIVKLDEDMILLPDTISCLLSEYQAIKADGAMDPGFVAPMIPLNGVCYRHLLETLGLLAAYEATFGPARIATAGVPLQDDPAAARWIWERTSPLSATASHLREAGPRWIPCPIQFSIGLIAFERRFWEQIGYLAVHRRRLMMGQSTLGGDEAYLCAKALELSRPAVVTTATVAGHFSFGPQYAGMKAFLKSSSRHFTA